MQQINWQCSYVTALMKQLNQIGSTNFKELHENLENTAKIKTKSKIMQISRIESDTVITMING